MLTQHIFGTTVYIYITKVKYFEENIYVENWVQW